MSGRHWTVDDDALLIDGHTVIPHKYLADCITRSEYDELVACVRDADTLAKARKLAARLRDRIDPDGVPVDREATVTALLDLLRGDQ